MTNHSLLSVGQLCNDGYYVTFRIDAVTIYSAAGKSILKGSRDLKTGIWHINLRYEQPLHAVSVANKVYELRNTGALVNYLHKTMFSPTKSALLQAVNNGHLITWSGLTEQAINKHFKMTPATAMGHMNQCRSITSDIKCKAVTPAGVGSKTNLVCAVRGYRPGTTLHRSHGTIPGKIQKRQLVRHDMLFL
jgi:hypothetical protein